MGHSYNQGVRTSNRGSAIEAFRVTFAGGAGAPTLVDNGKAGLLSVVRTSAGLYTFTIGVPVPPKFIAVLCGLSCVNATGAVRTARYIEGSYNASAGTFQIAVTDDEATPAAIDPTDNTALDVVLVTQVYTTL